MYSVHLARYIRRATPFGGGCNHPRLCLDGLDQETDHVKCSKGGLTLFVHKPVLSPTKGRVQSSLPRLYSSFLFSYDSCL